MNLNEFWCFNDLLFHCPGRKLIINDRKILIDIMMYFLTLDRLLMQVFYPESIALRSSLCTRAVRCLIVGG